MDRGYVPGILLVLARGSSRGKRGPVSLIPLMGKEYRLEPPQAGTSGTTSLLSPWRPEGRWEPDHAWTAAPREGAVMVASSPANGLVAGGPSPVTLGRPTWSHD